MLKIIFLLIVTVGVHAASTDLNDALKKFLESATKKGSQVGNADSVKSLYDLYKNQFNRLTNTVIEEKERLNAFNDTLNAMVQHYVGSAKAFSVGLNEYADRTSTELKGLRGVQVPVGDIKATNAKPGDRFLTWQGKQAQEKAALPASFDYTTRVVTGTNVPVILPIKNQGSCGSCYSFAFISLLEFQYAIQLKSSKILSEQQLMECSTLDNGCRGGYFTNTFIYLQSNSLQVDSGAHYPYKMCAGSCLFQTSTSTGVRFGSLVYQRVTVNDATAMQQALVNYGPLWVSLFVGDESTSTYSTISRLFNAYASGVFQPSGCPTSVYSTNHAVVIVGYGVDAITNVPYWTVRNSWGATWGEKGYFRIRRGVNMCGIESGAFYIARPA